MHKLSVSGVVRHWMNMQQKSCSTQIINTIKPCLAHHHRIGNTVSQLIGLHTTSRVNVGVESENENPGDVVKDCGSDKDIDVLLSTVTNSDDVQKNFTEVEPGKGPPPEPPMDCCMSGCANCVWIAYAEELKDYFIDGSERALREIEKIENPSLKAFVKLELSLR